MLIRAGLVKNLILGLINRLNLTEKRQKKKSFSTQQHGHLIKDYPLQKRQKIFNLIQDCLIGLHRTGPKIVRNPETCDVELCDLIFYLSIVNVFWSYSQSEKESLILIIAVSFVPRPVLTGTRRTSSNRSRPSILGRLTSSRMVTWTVWVVTCEANWTLVASGW